MSATLAELGLKQAKAWYDAGGSIPTSDDRESTADALA